MRRKLIRYYLSREWQAIAVILSLILVVIGFGLVKLNQLSGEFTPVEATITGMGSDSSWSGIYTSAKIVVVATTDEGLIGRTSVEAALVHGCQIGDTVSAAKKDGILRVFPRPCVK